MAVTKVEVRMGRTIRQPTAATALTLGGIPIKISPSTLILIFLVATAWGAVAFALVIGAENRWAVTGGMAACTLSIAVIAFKSVEYVGRMFVQQSERMEAATASHLQGVRKQVVNMDWLMTSKFRGEARAKIDAARAVEEELRDPTDTGPFTAINGAR